jgi:hypothetical protein
MDPSVTSVDISGETIVDASEPSVTVSGGVVDVSGEVVDVSGGVVDVSGEVVDVSGGVMDMSGTVVDVSDTFAPAPAPAPVDETIIRLDDILSSQSLLKTQELSDKGLLEGIGNIPVQVIKPRLIQWASTGFQNAYPIYDVPIRVPPICSDGERRTLQDYVQFVSGKTIQEHVATLQTRLPDIVVSFAYFGSSITIVVSKAGSS